jgi:DNA repair exonuclease SbcCD ATPase subunit
MTDLIERLRRIESNQVSDFFATNWQRNPDGPEAADALDAQAARIAELERENSRLIAANKARDEFLRGHRYKRSEMDGYIDLCESQMASLKDRIAELERELAAMEHGGVCIWCGEALDLTGKEIGAAVEWARAHDASCPDNPLRRELAEARELLEETETYPSLQTRIDAFLSKK